MQTFFWLFYNLLWLFFLPLWLFIQLWQWIRNPFLARVIWKERLALYPQKNWTNKPVFWFHGSSLGEVLSLLPLIQECKKQWGDSQILTVSTSRGHYIAHEKKLTSFVSYLPFDWFIWVRRAITKLQPSIVIVFETEIWPNLFWECQRQKIPIVIVSGRISSRSFPRYRLARSFFKTVLSQAFCLMQSQEDAERIQEIGADPAHIFCTGDIKLDGLKMELQQEEQEFLQKYFQFIPKPIIVVGSTHPGEEEMIFNIAQKFQQINLQATFIIAPRHLNRMPEIIKVLQQKNMNFVIRSQLQPDIQENGPTCNILILDTYGELSRVYFLATMVIMGGTFSPIGGHNLMEAAALAKPVIFGPHISNCRKQAKLLLEKTAGIQVQNSLQLEEVIQKLLSQDELVREMGKRGQDAIRANIGALQHSLEKIKSICLNYDSSNI